MKAHLRIHAERGMPAAARAGLTLIEYLIAVVVLSIFIGSLMASMSSLLRVEQSGTVRVQAQESGQRALRMILTDLRATGYRDAYPHFFQGGVATGAFAIHAHEPALKAADDDDRDFGPDREIVIQLPADDDRNGAPDFDVDGSVRWSAEEVSYVLITGIDGVNVLQRRVNSGSARAVARNVERVTFEDINTDPSIPFGSIRIRLWFRLQDDSGLTYTHSVEATVRPRNTILPGDETFAPALTAPDGEPRPGESPAIG